jgi:hypothetical protein
MTIASRRLAILLLISLSSCSTSPTEPMPTTQVTASGVRFSIEQISVPPGVSSSVKIVVESTGPDSVFWTFRGESSESFAPRILVVADDRGRQVYVDTVPTLTSLSLFVPDVRRFTPLVRGTEGSITVLARDDNGIPLKQGSYDAMIEVPLLAVTDPSNRSLQSAPSPIRARFSFVVK